MFSLPCLHGCLNVLLWTWSPNYATTQSSGTQMSVPVVIICQLLINDIVHWLPLFCLISVTKCLILIGSAHTYSFYIRGPITITNKVDLHGMGR